MVAVLALNSIDF